MSLQAAALLSLLTFPAQDDGPALLQKALTQLVAIQEESGAWPYEGVYRVDREIPVAYRVGGTAIVAGALLHAAPDDEKARRAVDRGLEYVLGRLDDPLLAASTEDAYDVRVWGQLTALEFLCQVREAKRAGGRLKEVDAWLPRLVRTLTAEELEHGGWNYAGRARPASFVTAPVTQALLYARGQKVEVSADVLERAKRALEGARAENGAFLYSGVFKDGESRYTSDQAEGSCARSAACEATLRMLGGGSAEATRRALEAFHAHWGELEKRRRKTGTHEGPYKIAPYYVYYGHRYAAQAIQWLPEADRAKERERLLQVILKTRDADGTWNDRVFDRSRAYGTAMIALALLGDRAPLPPSFVR
ncbi:MAG TPA: hypothetical protein VNM14_12390 [Planctomycetota bacterium]|nr:hypothetical protein [Planctomycetota bacterium]